MSTTGGRPPAPSRLAPAQIVPWAVIGLLLVLPLLVRDLYTMRLVNIIGINCLLALGLNLVIGVAGQLDAGQAGFFAIGAYTAGILGVTFGIPFWITLLLAAIASGTMALAIGPVLRLRGVFLAVATLAFGEIVRIVISNWIPVTRGPNGIPGIPPPLLAGFAFDTDQRYYYLVLAWVLIAYAVVTRMADSRIGRAMKAVRDNQDAAELMGVHALRYKIMAFAVAGAFAGIAGALLAHLQTYISPENFTFLTSVDIIFMVVLGGLGSAPGSVVGAFVVTVAPEWLRFLKDFRIIVYTLIILSVLIFAPGGLYGAIDRLRRRIARAPGMSGRATG
jgi:branched-chain amino acid transport system permease protein